MKTNSLLLSICAIALLASMAVSVQAQQDGSAPAPPPQSASAGSGHDSAGALDPDTPENDASLNFTDEQKEKIKSIRDDAKEQLKAAKKDTTLTDEQRQAKVKQIRKDTRKQIWAVMTPDQQKVWAQEMRERRQAKQSGAAGSAPPQ